MIKKLLALASIAVLGVAATAAHATMFSVGQTDTFTEGSSGTGQCCFNVVLTQETSSEVQVAVTITTPTFVFVNSGSGPPDGNHPTFAFNLDTTGVTLSTVSGWTNVADHNDTTGGPGFGTFNDQYNVDYSGSGGGSGVSTLIFDVSKAGGLNISDFIDNADDFYFTADLGINSNTATGGINTPGVPGGGMTPEPSSLMLLGTGILGASMLVRRRMHATNN